MAKAQGSLMRFGMIPMAATGLGFVIAAALSIVLVQSGVSADHRQLLSQKMAEELARQIDIKETAITEQLTKIAASDIATTAIRGSSADVVSAEATIATMIAGADRVKLIKRGQAKPDQGFPPFNYTAVDMVNKLEEGNQSAPEAISSQPQLGGERWVAFAIPISGRDNSLLGTLFVHIRADALIQGVSSGNDGEVSIMQAVGTTPKPVASVGSGGGTIYSAKLINPNWSLNFSPSSAISASSPGSIMIYLIPPLVLFLIAVGGIFVASNKTAAMIQADLSRLGQQITKVATGSFDDSIVYQIPGFEDQNSRLKVLEDMKPAPTAKPDASKPKIKTVQPEAKSQKDMVGIEMVDDDAEVEEIEVDDFDDVIEQASAASSSGADISADIFRAYDIRGVVGESLSEDIARQIGLAIGSEAEARGQQSLLVGFDGREYSPALAEALIDGLTSSGRDGSFRRNNISA